MNKMNESAIGRLLRATGAIHQDVQRQKGTKWDPAQD